MDPIVHFEIPADDMTRANKFYSGVFGWKFQDWTMPDGTVHVGIHTTEIDEQTRQPKKPGAINGMLVKRENNPAPVVTAHVASIDDTVEKIVAAGGSMKGEKIVVPAMGAYCYVSDTEGNVIGLWEDAKKA